MRPNKPNELVKLPVPLSYENPELLYVLLGLEVTINKSDYSQVTGKVVKISEQKIMLDLTKGIKGVETNFWLTIQDEQGTEHIGTLFVNQFTVL